MVHTRHSRDVGDDSPPRFLSLEDRKSRKIRPGTADFDEHDSDQSGIMYQSKGRSMFEEKVVESRLRPRTGPSRSYNYVFADSSDDELASRRRSRGLLKEGGYAMSRCKTRQHEVRCGQLEHSSDEEEEKMRSGWHSTRSRDRHQASSRQQSNRRDVNDEYDDGDHNEGDMDEDNDDEEDVNNSAVRRSSRLKKKPFRFRSSLQEEDKRDELDRGKRRRSGDLDNSSEEFEDMYSRVKRPRSKKPDDDERQQQSASNSDGTNDEEKNDTEDETQQRRSYSLRVHKPRTQLYIAPAIEGKKRTKPSIFARDSPPPRRLPKQSAYCSPAHRRPSIRKRQAFHGNSSSTSSDSSDSGTETSDEQRFNRRKAKSMAKARARICPLNFTHDMMASGVIKDRVRTGASLADVDPMEIDKSVTFESVGGLQEHIMKLKEMVVFPLLYPEFYERFSVAPSRGVLFYGPPGTGKTLVARALANECSRGEQKVAFFMRKGADCLSKWVGEAERQLRMLFDKAYEMRPSIIFFDEIDGLAPVRSSRQDQIHSSIVSTLLALMDGIDSRGEIVVIGATNRIDSIDPALRRPGRFDREFHFPLPNLQDRTKILKIHTKNWNPALRDDFLVELAEKCAGYCGADLKCLVTEATQNALRRRYPQIYTTSDKLQLDVSSITLTATDFAQAIRTIVPAAQRAVPNPAMALESSVRPLLSRALIKLQAALSARFPYSKLNGSTAALALQGSGSESAEPSGGLDVDLPVDEEENAPSIFMSTSRGSKSHSPQSQTPMSFLKFASSLSNFPAVFRPRMLVSGATGQGQSVHLAPAALHLMEHLPVHILNSATLFAASAKMPEEACANVFHEAKRTAPSIIYIPYVNELWGVVSDSLRVTFLTLMRSMNPSTPILMLATSETTYPELDDQLKTLFSLSAGEVVEVDGPTTEERRQFFHDLIMHQTIRPPPTHRQAARRVLEPLAKAPPPQPRKLTEKEQRKLDEQEEDTLRELRIFLRDILSKLGREKKFGIFTKPVDIEEVPDYYDIIKKPMDLSTMMSNIDLHKYNTASAFLDDIFLICSNALEYNPDRGPTDRAIRHRACALRDTAQALLKAELDPEFERVCQEITQSRKRRGVDSSQSVPAFYHTRPLGTVRRSTPCDTSLPNADAQLAVQPASAVPEGCRYSRRVRGLEADNTLPLEAVERSAQLEKSLLAKDKESPQGAKDRESLQKEQCNTAEVPHVPLSVQDGEGGHRVVEGSKKSDSMNVSLEESIPEEDNADGADRADCKCPSSSRKGPSNNLSGRTPKGSSDSKHVSAHAAKKASRLKKCPWLATKRRRRLHSTPAHRHEMINHSLDAEELSGEESMDAEHSPSMKLSEGWERDRERPPSRREHSPMSAANPANVNDPSITRRRSNSSSSSNIPAPQAQESVEVSKQEASGGHSPRMEGPRRKSAIARSLDMELMVVATDSGISSESNGDSRDSLDHNNSNRNNGSAESQEITEDRAASTTATSGPSFARTRSRTQCPLQQSALAALEAEGGSVVVDEERLASLLDTVVHHSKHFTVERLQHLYSVLSCAIFNHRYQLDKTQVIQEMENVVEKLSAESESH